MTVEGKRVLVNPKRWPGVYKTELSKRFKGKPDFSFTISYKDPVTGRKIWEKIGKKSEGITEQICSEERSDRIRKGRLGEDVKTAKDIQKDQLKYNKPLGKIAEAYFKAKEGELKGHQTDTLRWKKHLEPLFKERRISSITSLDIQRLKKSLSNQKLATATIWNVLELLRRLCNWGKRHRMSPGLSFIIRMPKKDNEVVEFLTPEQAQSLDKVLNGWESKDIARMIRIAMLTGMRRGEIFRLEDKDLDWQHNLIHIRSPKGGRSERIPMADTVAGILKEQTKWRDETFPGSPYVFPGREGKLRVDCSGAKRIKEKADLPKNFRIFHGLRHHYAVTLANSGKVDLSLIGQLLTHKSHAMTKRYASYLPETTKAAAELAAGLIAGNIKAGEKEEPEAEMVKLKEESRDVQNR